MSTARKMLILFVVLIGLTGLICVYRATYAPKPATADRDPKQLFDSALIENLSETGVTCTLSRTRSGTTERQTVQLDLTSKTNARSVLKLTTADTTVETEELSIGKSDYLRYTKVDTKAANPQGQKPDYTKVLNKWIKADTTSSELFTKTALGGCVVPLANLSAASQLRLSRPIESGEAFAADVGKSMLTKADGRQVRNYNVTIKPQAYTGYMQAVAKAAGLSALDDIRAADYADKQVREATFSIDTATGRLVRIQFSDETRSIVFGNYGKIPYLQAPSPVITSQEADKLIAR